MWIKRRFWTAQCWQRECDEKITRSHTPYIHSRAWMRVCVWEYYIVRFVGLCHCYAYVNDMYCWTINYQNIAWFAVFDGHFMNERTHHFCATISVVTMDWIIRFLSKYFGCFCYINGNVVAYWPNVMHMMSCILYYIVYKFILHPSPKRAIAVSAWRLGLLHEMTLTTWVFQLSHTMSTHMSKHRDSVLILLISSLGNEINAFVFSTFTSWTRNVCHFIYILKLIFF